jgi:hypothetical protein
MNLREIRQASWETASKLGYPRNDSLPLLDNVDLTRSKEEVTDRIFAMLCVAASACGFDRNKALTWLWQNGKLELLTHLEREFLEGTDKPHSQFMTQVEGKWALCWCLQIIPELDFSKACSDDFVTMFPDLKSSEPGSGFRGKAALRDVQQILPKLDLAYCLHWGIVENGISARKGKTTPAPYVTIERRRALEWMFSNGRWDEISMDT